MTAADTAAAAAAAWDDLADAVCEHDLAHERRAVAELIRLGQLVPAQRRPGPTTLGEDLARIGAAAAVAARMLAASDVAVVQLLDLETSLHAAAAALEHTDPARSFELRCHAEAVAGRRSAMRRLAMQDYDVAETLPAPPALTAALTPGPHCLGCAGTCRRCPSG